SRFTWTFFLKTKDETSGILRKFITEIENLKDLKVKIIRFDNGGEFRNKEINDFCSQKGIKSEFSNARTPQQNGVAERRNRTLIEAARTMVLVNKTQNKTPYELFNGRTPAIGFLKPFGCHVMILNTLENLRKFEAKGDEGYFIRYSMSSKAFRVFNKRTKRVEENLHVEFLENKAIEKGDGPNWLFDIDSLTKSMNYVLVDAGTNSINLSGTKDAARQEVKKDVSSLRYIALPNWVHDALLESSSSKPQDDCSIDVLESSGNSNPTATSANPLADQLETLTVETPILTVSSPVLTACFTNSPEPSSDTRLISKIVANQVETPSLDNILTLTNRFEDILGVTTNSVDSDGVEADVSNMETTITASPTPTLRIHKDHPKSQIISPLDTLIQTRNKSKEVGEQSFIAIIHQKTDPALLQFYLFSCFLSQVEPKKISDSLQDPRPIGTKWVLKNKKDKRGIVIRNKSRLVAQGHTQEEGINYDEVFAPVARIEAIRLFLAYVSFMGFTVYQMDVKSAFLYGTINEEVYMMQPPGFQDTEFPAKVYKVEKAIEFKALMHEKFQMSAIGELNFFLGLQVLQKEDGIFLTQDKYVGDILKKFRYSDVRSSNTPMDKENPWGKNGTGKDVDLHLYRSMIGSLMYLTASRPDIMFAICAYARHQVTPKECHLHAVKRIFRYLKGHPKLGIWYPKEFPFDLVAYSDSDYGGAPQDHKSTTEGCQFLGRRLISWQCKKQTIMATSTTEAEYGAAARTSKYWGVLRILMISLRLIPLSEHNVDFYPIVDFVEASPLMYALTVKPTVYVSHIRQFWSTARIEITEEGTKILATVDGILRTVTESYLRRNLKLKDEEGISSLPDAKLFANLTLMGYNISPNQKFTFQKGQFSHQWKYLIHTIMQCLSPKSTGFNEFSSNIATALVCLATNRTYNFSKIIFDGMVKNVNNKDEGSGTPTEPHHTPSPKAQHTSYTTHSSPTLSPITTAFIPTVTLSDTPTLRQYTKRARIAQSSALPPVADEPASPLRDVSEGKACPTDSSFKADQDRANIAKTSTLPHDSAPRVTSLAVDEGSMQLKLDELTGVAAKRSGDDAPIKGRNLDEGEVAAERVSDDTEEMATVLTSMDAATVLASRVAKVPTGSGSIPTAGPPAAEVPTGSGSTPTVGPSAVEVPTDSDVVPTAGLIFATATVVTPYTRRKGKETMIDRDAEIARIYVEEELQIMIDGLDRSNETTQQRKPWSKKQKRDYYMAIIRSNLGWKVKDFIRMTIEEIEAKFTTVWKQLEDFIPIGSKEKAERFKRKGIRFEQESVKKLKTSEEVPEEVKIPDEVPKEKVHIEGQRNYWKIIRLGGSSASYQLFVDLLKHMDREDLNQLWALVKESLSIRQPTSDKEMELWVELKRLYEPDDEDQLWTHTQNLMHAPVEWRLYDMCGVNQVTSKDKEIFMLVEKDYPLRKGLVIVMICYKLQVENYSQMASDLILKIHKIASSPRQQGTKDAANQEVKKDVSSLRYIILPNWAHDDLLEFSLSKPYDESSSQVPKGSGNPNPTVSSSNPPANQMETITVESPILTVSSPVPTACLNDSQEPSSEARLISKRFANQEETLSLDNILSLTNRFEDTLGVTTSSDESIGVEADVSNMETSISASPTPTLRIHKDHPKS
nr:hypothetical protein [Tanacetum cinerariifolium]